MTTYDCAPCARCGCRKGLHIHREIPDLMGPDCPGETVRMDECVGCGADCAFAPTGSRQNRLVPPAVVAHAARQATRRQAFQLAYPAARDARDDEDPACC